MRRLALILIIVLLFGLTACQANAPIEGTSEPFSVPSVPATTPKTEDKLDLTYWNQFSDYDLLQKTIESRAMLSRQLFSVVLSAEEWKDYVLDNCEPLRALVLRDTAFASVKEHAADLVEQHQDDSAGMRTDNFILLVVTLYPDMERQFADYEYVWPPATGTEPTIAVDVSK